MTGGELVARPAPAQAARVATMLRELAAAGVRAERIFLRVTDWGAAALRGCPEFTWIPRRYSPTGTWRGAGIALDVIRSGDNLGPFRPDFELRGLYPQQIAWQIAEHYREGIGPARGQYSIVVGLDVLRPGEAVQHPGVVDHRLHAGEIADLATRLIGAPGVRVEPWCTWQDGWTLIVEEEART